MELTKIEEAQIRAARDARVIVDVNGHKLNETLHTIGLVCPDCDKCPDIEEFHQKMTGTKRHHFFKLNGGALLLSLHSPLSGASARASVILEDVVEAIGMKKISTFATITHLPCGKARGCHSEPEVDFFETLRLHLEGKDRARRYFKTKGLNIKIPCFVQVGYSDRMRSYFVEDGDGRAEEFLKLQGRGLRPQF